jgi:hypothetical protein
MSCPCDITEFPPQLYIPAGLSRLPRQIAMFPEFRAALLHDIGSYSALRDWRGRQTDDFGVMLLEMWAYVCDVTAFYDEVIAHENYLRTARQRSSLRKLIGLLGYVPRPAVAASVELAAFADGRKALVLPAATAFRSGAFDGQPPQVFELTAEAIIHPLSNEWEIQPIRPTSFGSSSLSTSSLLCQPGTVAAKVDDLVLLKAGGTLSPALVTAVADYTGADGERYIKVDFDRNVTIPANTMVSSVRLLKAGSRAPISPLIHSAAAGEDHTYVDSPAHIYLDSVYRSIRTGQSVILERNGSYFARSVTGTSEDQRTVTEGSEITFTPSGGTATKVTVPAIKTPLTKLNLNSGLGLSSSCGHDITVHFAFASAGTVTVEALTTLQPTDALTIQTPVEVPVDADAPSQFQLEDKNSEGVTLGASLVYPTGVLQLDQGTEWTPAGLVTPVRAFGNVISATRGESVNGESLGTGDASLVNQTFKLKKSPLTYLPSPTASNDSGVASTLSVYVEGVLWTEVATFYGQSSDAEVYLVRQNDDEESSVIFGDGVRGCRLPTGASVVAYYRFGGGAAMPPAGSINQLGKPVAGLRAIRNPVAATGGADAEQASELQKYAPRSALLLGRAISLLDLEAAAASVGGVRAARAEWRWNQQRLRPGAQIYYVGDSGLDSTITQRLRGLAEEDLPIDVVPATPLPRSLSIQIEIDARYLEADVVAAVRAALMDTETGLLAPERVGIGLPLFRSRIYEFVLRTPGASSVTSLLLDSVDFGTWAVSPGSGNYFDFENGTLLLNGS